MLDSEELVEFVRLHEAIAGLGGTLDSTVGAIVRGLIEGNGGTVGRGVRWDDVFKVDGSQQVDTTTLMRNFEAGRSFIFMVNGTCTSLEVAGVVLRKVSGNSSHMRSMTSFAGTERYSGCPSGL